MPSILRRLLYRIDNKDIDWSLGRFQPQSKLLLNRREQRWHGIGRSRRGRCSAWADGPGTAGRLERSSRSEPAGEILWKEIQFEIKEALELRLIDDRTSGLLLQHSEQIGYRRARCGHRQAGCGVHHHHHRASWHCGEIERGPRLARWRRWRQRRRWNSRGWTTGQRWTTGQERRGCLVFGLFHFQAVLRDDEVVDRQLPRFHV